MAQPYQLMTDPILGTARTVLRVEDNAFIPFDPANRDYQEYLAWLEAGNEPDPPEPK
jgi:hypothetical protein